MKKNTLTIGTRGSKLALIYAEKVKRKNNLQRIFYYIETNHAGHALFEKEGSSI